jgi:hypothetical protein
MAVDSYERLSRRYDFSEGPFQLLQSLILNGSRILLGTDGSCDFRLDCGRECVLANPPALHFTKPFGSSCTRRPAQFVSNHANAIRLESRRLPQRSGAGNW